MDSFINPKMLENLQEIYDGEQNYSFFFFFILFRILLDQKLLGGVADGHPRRHRGQALQTTFLQLFLQSLQAIKATGTMGRALSSSPSAARLWAS